MSSTSEKAKMLGKELDFLLKAEKERAAVLKDGSGASLINTDYVLYQTLYAYKSEDPDDLNFEAGEILRVYDEDGDWFEGENQDGKRGTFPSTFVRKIPNQATGPRKVENTT